jgi:hypothetical protein
MPEQGTVYIQTAELIILVLMFCFWLDSGPLNGRLAEPFLNFPHLKMLLNIDE